MNSDFTYLGMLEYKGLVNNLSDLVEDKLHVDKNISIELSGLKFFCL